jgi:hypothetical protein
MRNCHNRTYADLLLDYNSQRQRFWYSAQVLPWHRKNASHLDSHTLQKKTIAVPQQRTSQHHLMACTFRVWQGRTRAK